jgi:L-ascorbate metabolism protein UlaG (beta-lactamase superfamily)
MRITKYGHCCLLVEEKGIRILLDPGSLTAGKQPTERIDVLLITHEHTDHLHVPSVQAVAQDSPGVKIYTIPSVGAFLRKEGIPFSLLEHGGQAEHGGVRIEAFGEKHAVMHPDIPVSDNTGFFVAERLFYPGDAFTDPGKRPEILALPVAGPWMKLSEAVDYARKLKPDVSFPVHDGVVTEAMRDILSVMMPARLLQEHGIRHIGLKEGESTEL